MDGMYGSIKQADTVYYLPDPALSILIGQLKQKSLENGIRFRIFNTVTNYYLPSHELCSLVNNLVNNAIESTCKLPEENRTVYIDLMYDDGGYHIEVGNNAPLGTDCNKFNTSSKADKENHGIGMEIIHTIARKHHGFVSISVTTGAELGRDYDYVSINVAMKFKEIARIQCEHKEKENFNV